MNGCKRSYSSKILEIGKILGEKIERKVYVNQQNFVSDIQLLIKYSFLLSFLHELLMSITISYISCPLFFYLATAGVNHHVLLWNPYVISKPVGVSMKKKTLFFLPFNLSCFFFFLFLHLFHLSSSHHSPPFLLSLVILFFVFFFSSFSSFSSFTSLSSSFSSFSFSFSFLLLQLCLFFKVLRGHMQSVISANFIQSRGQTISLSKDKVSMS